jgi:hypothetical protein
VLCILVNRQPNGKNHVIVKNGSFRLYAQYELFEILGTNSVWHVGNGYILNETIGIIAQVFMSKPNK